jgi:hypothetical protein
MDKRGAAADERGVAAGDTDIEGGDGGGTQRGAGAARKRAPALIQPYGPSRGDPDSYDEDPAFGIFAGCNDAGAR